MEMDSLQKLQAFSNDESECSGDRMCRLLESLEIGDTVAHEYARTNQHEALRALLEPLDEDNRVRVIISQANDRGETVMHIAGQNVDTAACIMSMVTKEENKFKILIPTDGQSVNTVMGVQDVNCLKVLFAGLSEQSAYNVLVQRNTVEATSFHVAADIYPWQVTEFYLNTVSESKHIELLNMANRVGGTALMIAVENGQLEYIYGLWTVLSDEAKLAVLTCHNRVGGTAVMIASEKNNVGAMKALLGPLTKDQRLKVLDEQNFKGGTALMIAAEKGFTQMAECIINLLDGRDRFNHLSKKRNEMGATALMVAAERKCSDVIRAILESVDDEWKKLATEDKNQVNANAIHLAAISGDDDAINQILRRFSQEELSTILRLTDQEGRTVLHYAALTYLTSGYAMASAGDLPENLVKKNLENVEKVKSYIPKSGRKSLEMMKDNQGRSADTVARGGVQSKKSIGIGWTSR